MNLLQRVNLRPPDASKNGNYAFFGSAMLALLSALMALYVRRIPLPQKSLRQALSVQPSAG
jgi:hypothetical protein